MPKIPQYLQDKKEAGEIDTEPRGRGPVPEGFRALRLVEFEEETKTAGDGINCTFKIVEGANKGSVLKYNWISFSEGGIWKAFQLLAAAGYSDDSDFQELVDDEADVVAYVAIEIQEKGKNAGKEVNNITEFHPVNDDSMSWLD